jgi:hypothetical protein
MATHLNETPASQPAFSYVALAPEYRLLGLIPDTLPADKLVAPPKE